jgi:hypothetical protein
MEVNRKNSILSIRSGIICEGSMKVFKNLSVCQLSEIILEYTSNQEVQRYFNEYYANPNQFQISILGHQVMMMFIQVPKRSIFSISWCTENPNITYISYYKAYARKYIFALLPSPLLSYLRIRNTVVNNFEEKIYFIKSKYYILRQTTSGKLKKYIEELANTFSENVSNSLIFQEWLQKNRFAVFSIHFDELRLYGYS